MTIREEGPDQPRSWAIALAGCTINTLLSGISRATGLLYVALIDTYGVSRFQANLPFTARNIVRNLGGPLVGAIGQRYGPRDVTIVGGIFAALGIILCTFAPDVIWITILWGGMHGIGVGLANTLLQVVVAQYFLKYRATASGLALSGACVGSFTFPILLEYLLIHLGLSGTFLVTGGLVLHVLPAAIMLVEPPWTRRKVEVRPKPESLQFKKIEKVSKPAQMMSVIQEEPNNLQMKKSNAFKSHDVSDLNIKETLSPSTLKLKQSGKDAGEPTTFGSNLSGVDNPAYSGSRTDLSGKSNEQVLEPEGNVEKLRTLSLGEISMTIAAPPDEQLQETSLLKGILRTVRNPMFHMISASLGAFAVVFDPTITVIVDYLRDKGLEEDVAKYFISVLAVGDLLGRLCFGWVTDKKLLSIPIFMMVLQVGNGVCFLLLPFFYSFDALMTLTVLHGMISGATLIMYPLLVGKYLQSVQSLAIGCISFLSGILTFAIPPLIGYFRDQVGSYDGMFLITGSLSLVIGLFWFLEPLLVKLGAILESKKNASSLMTS